MTPRSLLSAGSVNFECLASATRHPRAAYKEGLRDAARLCQLACKIARSPHLVGSFLISSLPGHLQSFNHAQQVVIRLDIDSYVLNLGHLGYID
jgi:hypothetical protein